MPTFRGAADNLNSGSYSHVTVASPAGLQEGDYCIVQLLINDVNITFDSIPDSFTLLDSQNFNSFYSVHLFTGFAGPSEPSIWDFDWGSPVVNCNAIAVAYSDVNPTSPLEAWDGTISGADEDPVHVGGTLTEDLQTMVATVMGYEFSQNSITWTTDGNERIDVDLDQGSTLVTAAAADKSPGSTGDLGIDLNPSKNLNRAGAYVFVLNPASRDYELSGSSVSLSETSGEVNLDVALSGSSESFSDVDADLSLGNNFISFPEYEFFIDWDSDGGLRLFDFINSTDGWQEHGTTPPTLSVSDEQAFHGDYSLKVNWQAFNPFRFDDPNAGFDDGKFGAQGFENTDTPFTFNDANKGFDDGQFGVNETQPELEAAYVTTLLTGLTPGKIHTFSMWVYPVNNHCYFEIENVVTSDTTSNLSLWQELSVEFIATSNSHVVTVRPEDVPADDDNLYIDYVSVKGQFEQVVPQDEFSFSRGRDNSRALSPVTPAETELRFLNRDGRYVPENKNSVLYPNVGAGREGFIRAVWEGGYYDLFWGLLDDLSLDPETGEESATFSFVDTMAFLGQTKLDTPVYRGQRTGDAIHKVLDAIGWPETKRDIDAGATVIRWWWAYDVDASDAISEIVASEGTPAYATLDASGNFVFRDRHHRLLSERSTSVQTTLRASSLEPMFSPPMEINLGWKDVLNAVQFEVVPYKSQPMPPNINNDNDDEGRPQKIWWHEDAVTIPVGETVTFKAAGDNPFVNAQDPVPNPGPGFRRPITHQRSIYTVLSGDVEVFLSRHSGQSTDFHIKNVGATTATVKDLALHAIPIVEDETGKQQIVLKDSSAISSANRESSHNLDTPWANINDANAIAQVVLGQRANRLPTVEVTVKGANRERIEEILTRRISDRIRIVEPRSFTNHEFFVEGISHDVSAAGKYHEAVFSCERIPVYDSDVSPFRFDDATAGFDNGVFGYDGRSDPDEVFILGVSKLSEGFLGF